MKTSYFTMLKNKIQKHGKLNGVLSMLLVVSVVACGGGCFWFLHEPKQPEGISVNLRDDILMGEL